MKRIILMALCVGFAVFPTSARDDLIVGIEQDARAEWEAIADSFEAQFGVKITLHPYPQASIAQEVVIQAVTKSGKLHFVMIPSSWGTSLASYLVDLSDVAPTLATRGIAAVTVANRPVGVPLPFTSNWFLGVLSWPEDRSLAIDLLVHAAAWRAATAAPATTSQAAAASFAMQKLPAADHNPILDGALGALLGAARASSTSPAAPGAPVSSSSQSATARVASQYGVPLTPAGTVTVVLEALPGRSTTSAAAALASVGVGRSSIETTSTLVKATVSLSQLSSLASTATGVAFIRPPYIPYPMAVTSQGVAAIGADAFHIAGFDGSGVKIAVIDLGFSGLSTAQSRGDLPYSVRQSDLTGTGLASGITHGTAVAEIIHDVAPGAELHLVKIADEVDLDAAVTYCLSQGIDIINHSLGWYNTNFYDGIGTIPDIARRATSGGILWVNAAGNEAESHWEGIFSDANSDGWLDQTVTLYASAGSQIVLFLTWNEWPQASSDYDLYLYDPATAPVASSTKYQTGTEEPTESIQVAAPVSGTYTVRIRGSGYRSLELFSLHQSLAPAVASSSILAPANASEVIAVAAIDHARYTTGPQEPYSSQGPTNNGRTKPDLAAPDKTSTGTSPYTTFYGTSGAAPHVAGAAALLLDQNPSLTPTALRAHLLSQTVPMGSPNVYGNGRLALTSPATPNQPPIASFAVSPTSGAPGTTFSFTGASSYDPDGTIVGYQWTFGDGSSGSGVAAQHAYASPGTYTVRLTVTDNGGASNATTRSVSVSAPTNQSPVASFAVSPTSGAPGTTFSFTGASSYDPDGTIVGYQWTFGDGSSGSGVAAQHAYASPGPYTVRLTVTDNGGASNATTRSVSVSAPTNQSPVASFAVSPTSGAPGTTFSFTGASSYDPDGTIVGYQWTFGDGSSGSGVAAQHAYASPGTYTVRLTVTDNGGASNTTTRSVSVQSSGMPDLVVESMVASPTNPSIGKNVTFTLAIRNRGAAAAGLFRVRLAGRASSTDTYVTRLAAGASETFMLTLPLTASPETFTATADDLRQVAESDEENNIRTLTVTGRSDAPIANAGGPYTGTPGTPIAFDGSGSTGPISTYQWSFGDGTTAQGVTASHTYSTAGTYQVSLTVYGQDGRPTTDSTQAVVSAAGPSLAVRLSLPKSLYEVGEAITVTFTTNRTAYVYLCDASPDGRVTLMLPNWLEPNNPLPAGTHVVPGPAYTLRVTEPVGTETLYLFAATSPLAQFPKAFGSGFSLLSTNPTGFRNSVLSTMQSLPNGEWAHDTLSFRIGSQAPTTGTLQVFSSPPGAAVELDGSAVGVTPWSDGIAPGIHSVHLSRAGYAPQTRQVVVTAGQTATLNVSLTPAASNQAPAAGFSYTPQNPAVGEAVRFDASSSFDPDGAIASYSWAFGDGASALGAAVSHVYAANMTYTVRLTVTDNSGATDTATRSVAVSSASDVGWISPASATSPGETWAFEERTHDNDLSQHASANVPLHSWTTFLELSPGSAPLFCDGIRLLLQDTHSGGSALRWDLDVLIEGKWHDAGDDVFEEMEWVVVRFPAAYVQRARLRAYANHLDSQGNMAAFVKEVDFHDATVPES